jgi:hypothetical protein
VSHRFPCGDLDCDFCQNRAEERAEPEPLDDDPGGQDQYERYIGA